METHPDRDHIRREIDSQERRARALIRSGDMPDVSWPTREGTTLEMERLPELGEFLDTSVSEEDEEDYREVPPPPYCAPGMYEMYNYDTINDKQSNLQLISPEHYQNQCPLSGRNQVIFHQ